MSLLSDLVPSLQAGQALTEPQLSQAALALSQAEVPEAEKAAFLRALARKGETAEEIAGFARAFRAKAIDPEVSAWSDQAIDIVGTGGDHAGGFNISSLVVLTLAAAGVKVMKHGNRGITSKCGSADLLAALGFRLEADPAVLRRALDELGYVFFFAPAFHPTFKHIGPVRKALAAEGQRTVFNILGPLINPGRPAHVLLGVFSETWVPRLASALEQLGVACALVAHGRLEGDRGIDELTSVTPCRVRGVGRLAAVDDLWLPGRFGLPTHPFADLVGGDVAENLQLVERLLAGQGPAGLVDTIVLNTATALWILGRVPTVEAGLPLARECLLGGAVSAKIAATRDFFQSV